MATMNRHVAPLGITVLLALSGAASCEILIGIPDVTLDTGAGGTSGGGTGGTGGTAGTGGTGGTTPDCPLGTCTGDACAPVTLATVEGAIGVDGNIYGLAVGDGVVFWAAESPSKKALIATPVAGGSSEVLYEGGATPGRMAADAQDVFWTGPYRACVTRQPISGGPDSEIGPCVESQNQYPPGLALSDTHVLWAVTGIGMAACPLLDGCCGPAGNSCLIASPKDASEPLVLAGGISFIGALADAGDSVVFVSVDADDEGTIVRCPKAAVVCEPAVLTSGSGTSQPIWLAAGGGHVYWGNSGGEIRRVAVDATEPSEGEVVAEATYLAYLFADTKAVYFSTAGGKMFAFTHEDPLVKIEQGGVEPYEIGTDCENVYYADAGKLQRRPR